MKKRSFFDNIGAILTYAVLGTFISAVVFGTVTYTLVLMHIISPKSLGAAPFAECFMYGAAISSIDPVATLRSWLRAIRPRSCTIWSSERVY